MSGRKPDASGSAQHVETCVHSRASGVMEDGGCETESRKRGVVAKSDDEVEKFLGEMHDDREPSHSRLLSYAVSDSCW